jgi:hypothetical protein
MTFCHITQPKQGETVRSVYGKDKTKAPGTWVFVFGQARGVSKLSGSIREVGGKWPAKVVEPLRSPQDSPNGLWVFKFEISKAGEYEVRVGEEEFDPEEHELHPRHAAVDRITFQVLGPGRDPINYGGPPTGDLCPQFWVTGSCTDGSTSVSVTLSVTPGNPAQAGLPMTNTTASPMSGMVGELWYVYFNVSEGSGRLIDATDSMGNSIPTQGPINNSNAACP